MCDKGYMVIVREKGSRSNAGRFPTLRLTNGVRSLVGENGFMEYHI